MSTATEEIGRTTGLEGRNAVVLGTEGQERADGWSIAAGYVTTQELAALGESNCVDGGRGRENRMGGEVFAGKTVLRSVGYQQ